MQHLLALFALATAVASAPAFADEDADYGVAPVGTLRLSDYSAPTPSDVPGAKRLGTAQLREWLRGETLPPPLLFDVLGGEAHDSLPGAIWLPGAGRGQSFQDSVQEQLAKTIRAATKDDRRRRLVFFCQGPRCWLSYNAALRAVALGYEHVYWYRGGIEAWVAAGGTLAPLRLTWRKPAG
ncbi:MAG TPA: rhodanese-like domain-containing protein [Burkholderiales bacterium]|jgi:PQQ-dependent catabolism-associated CXXCW motif protein|nr:rhodanese-like domain-containing protein [Burkholderiales bacterium]